MVPVTLNGTKSEFLVDTGATNTTLATDFASRLGIPVKQLQVENSKLSEPPSATTEFHSVDICSFQIAEVRTKAGCGQGLIADLSRVSLLAGEHIEGLIGNATLSSADYELDVTRPALRLHRALGLGRNSDANAIRVAGNKTLLPVEINGQKFEFQLDTGSSVSFVSPTVADALAGAKTDFVELEAVSIGSSEFKRFRRISADVAIGRVSIGQSFFLVGEENLLGLDLLHYGELLVSVRDHKFVFRPKE